MTTPLSSTAGKARRLLWARAVCLAVAWLAIAVAVLGGATAWPNWVVLVAVSSGFAGNLLRPTRPKASIYLVLAMALLSVIAVIGLFGAR